MMMAFVTIFLQPAASKYKWLEPRFNLALFPAYECAADTLCHCHYPGGKVEQQQRINMLGHNIEILSALINTHVHKQT